MARRTARPRRQLQRALAMGGWLGLSLLTRTARADEPSVESFNEHLRSSASSERTTRYVVGTLELVGGAAGTGLAIFAFSRSSDALPFGAVMLGVGLADAGLGVASFAGWLGMPYERAWEEWDASREKWRASSAARASYEHALRDAAERSHARRTKVALTYLGVGAVLCAAGLYLYVDSQHGQTSTMSAESSAAVFAFVFGGLSLLDALVIGLAPTGEDAVLSRYEHTIGRTGTTSSIRGLAPTAMVTKESAMLGLRGMF